MNNITDLISNTVHDLEICQLAPLFEIGSSSTIQITESYDIQIMSFVTATFIGILSMLYGLMCGRYFERGLTLHFVGIRRPSAFSKSQYKLFDALDTESTMITIKSSLKPSDTISALKELLRKTYSISDSNDILILYSHHIISHYTANEALTLSSFGITDNSLLTLAICNKDKIAQYEAYKGIQRDILSEFRTSEPVESVNQLFGMFEDEEEDEEETVETLTPRKGFDIVTQETDVLVYPMPICGHSMNKESLFEYALNIFNDRNNIKLSCPHTLCTAQWDYNAISEILKHDTQCKWLDFAKLELLSSRNKIETECNAQKCPWCKTLYFKNKNAFNMNNLAEIKSIADIERSFKTRCVLCVAPKRIETVKETVIMSSEPVVSVNELFGMFMDEDEEEEEEEEDTVAHHMLSVNELFGMFMDDDEEEEEVKYEEENGEFCFCCGSKWVKHHICDDSFRRDLCDILAVAETKKIGKVEDVPSIRCCPSCCQLLYHIDCCKHMRCKGCNTSFCHVCLKTKKDGKWQCGSSSTVCDVAERQNMLTLPDNIIITKTKFRAFDESEQKE